MINRISQATNSLLTQLVMELKSGYIRRCESLVLTPDEIQMLYSMTVEDLHYLLNSPVSLFSPRFFWRVFLQQGGYAYGFSWHQ